MPEMPRFVDGNNDDLDFAGSQAAVSVSVGGPPYLVEITGPAERMFDDTMDSFPVTFVDRNSHACDTYYELRCKLVAVGPVARELLKRPR